MSFIIPLFYRLLYMSIIASVIGITLILLKKFTSKGFSAKYNYFMWIIFIVALIFPAVLQSRLSLYNIIDLSRVQNLYMYPEEYALKNNITKIETEEIDKKVEPEKTEEVKNDSKIENADVTQIEANEAVNKKDYFSLIKNIIPYIWFSVFSLLLAFYIISYFILKYKIGKEELKDSRVRSILDKARNDLKVKKEFKLIKQNYIKSPALIGIFNPKILVVDGIQEFSNKNLEYIFRHEFSHYKRKDNISSTILAIIKIVYWFNPLIWIIIRAIRKDMELAADEIAVKTLDTKERKEYCKLLVYLSSIYNSGFAEKALGIADDKTNLEKRISMVKITDKISKHPVLSAILVFIIIGLVCLILYTNNYYEPELSEPPKLYIVNADGTEKEFLLTSYTWGYKNNVSNFNMGFNENTYDFTEENTIVIPYRSNYYIKTNPKLKTNIMNISHYKFEKGEFKFLYNSSINKYNQTDGYEFNETGVYLLNILLKDSRNNVAEYNIKLVGINGNNIPKIQELLNTKLSETEKVEQVINSISMASYLEKYEIVEKTLKLTYKYYPGDQNLNGMSAILFTCIDNLENIEFSFTHQKFSTLEYISEESTEMKLVKFQLTEPIMKIRDEVLQKNREESNILKGEY